MKNVAYGFALSAALLTVSGCCNWFSGTCDKKDQAATEETKAVAENEVQAAETATTIAEAAPLATAENVEQKVEAEKVATADTMPMNEVSPATATEAEKAV